MKNKKGFILSTYVYILLVFFLLLLSTMLAVLNNTRLLSKKLKEQSSNTSGLLNKDFSFVLLGDKEILLGKGEEFIDPGYIIKSSGGNDLSYKVKKTGKVNSNLVGIYELTYTATYNGVTKTISRIVKVGGTAVEKIESLATASNTEGLELTSDGNIRYTGASPKNYIKFNDEDWRIIGTFNMTTASGTTEKLMKIVKDTQFSTTMSWDSSASSVNYGWGINQWGTSTYTNGSAYEGADLMTMLNTYYIGESTTCIYCNGQNQEKCSNSCSSILPIGGTYRGMIEEVVWKTGAFSWGTTPVSSAYNAERGTGTGKDLCTSGTYCNDSVTRTTTWQGKVGLIYPSDYGYASTDISCRENINDNTNYSCKNTNWLHSGSTYWTISPYNYSGYARYAWNVDSSGYLDDSSAGNGRGVRPALYLKSDVYITSGDGSSGNAYQISMS